VEAGALRDRCQEACATRTLAYPGPSPRQIELPIGITMAPVGRRSMNGDLLGDGVIIASRLGGPPRQPGRFVRGAQPVYRARWPTNFRRVFVDIGEAGGHNIPHFRSMPYALASAREDRLSSPWRRLQQKRRAARIRPVARQAASVNCLSAVAGLFYPYRNTVGCLRFGAGVVVRRQWRPTELPRCPCRYRGPP